MIDKLKKLIGLFSKVNWVCCFLHVNNLITQLFVQQFDVPKLSELESVEDVEKKMLLKEKNVEDTEKNVEEEKEEEEKKKEVRNDELEGWQNEIMAMD